jgi:hypothetical protein
MISRFSLAAASIIPWNCLLQRRLFRYIDKPRDIAPIMRTIPAMIPIIV